MKYSVQNDSATVLYVPEHLDLCLKAKELEDFGKYFLAAEMLGELWQGLGKKPTLNQFPESLKAEILLRIGSLTGWIGSSKQIEGSQEQAKDLISEAIRLFENTENLEGVAESQSDLGVCYWREGAFFEAEVFLEEALAKAPVKNSDLRAKILLRLVNVAISMRKYKKAKSLLNKTSAFIKKSSSKLLFGKFHFHKALVDKLLFEENNNLNLAKSAVEEYQKASFYYQEINHGVYQANVETNLGFLLIQTLEYKAAHEHLDKAISLYEKNKNVSYGAMAYDTKARAFLAQNKLIEAELFAHKSVQMLKGGDEYSILAESLTTLGTILARRGFLSDSINTFENAIDKAIFVNDLESAGVAMLTKIEELSEHLSEEEKQKTYLDAEQALSNSSRRSIQKRLEKAHDIVFDKKEEHSWEGFSLKEETRKFEAKYIKKALIETNGTVTKAAKLLGITHQTLSQLLKQRHKDLIAIKKPRRKRSDRKKSKKQNK